MRTRFLRAITVASTGAFLAMHAVGTAFAADPSETDIRGIRGPVPLPASPPFAIYAGIVAASIVLFFIAWRVYLWRARRGKSAYHIASKRLQAAAALIEHDRGASFGQEVSDIVRQYIEQEFALRATHATTDEFLADLLERATTLPALAPHREELRAFLAHCDLAKFAGRGISESLMTDLLAGATRFVESSHEALRAERKKRHGRRPRRPRQHEGIQGVTR